jgi:hypothetical protein
MRNTSSKEKILGTIICVQGLVLLGQMTGGTPRSAHADLQVPNPSERQIETIEELKGVNARLDKVLTLMQSGELQVKMSKPDDAAAAKPDDPK